MTELDDIEMNEGGDDILAAEFVLGVLSLEERAAVARRIEGDHAFARLVDRWEQNFAPLAAAIVPVEPPASLKAAIDRKLFASVANVAPARPGFWQSLAVWRGLTFAAVAAAAIAVAVPMMAPTPVNVPVERLVSSLAADGSDVRYLALYDAQAGEISMSNVSGTPGAGEDFELWVIVGDNAPLSLGVVPEGDSVRLPTDEATRQAIAAGALFAISLEPDGGSPTGAPTGPVVAAGEIRAI